MPIRGASDLSRLADSVGKTSEPSKSTYTWDPTEPVDMSVFWPPHVSIPPQIDQAELQARLHIELAKQHQGLQNNYDANSNSYAPNSNTSSLSHISSADPSRGVSSDLSVPAMVGMDGAWYQWGALHSAANPNMPSGPWMSTLGMQETAKLQQHLQAAVPYVTARASHVDAQALAIDRSQREVAVLQNELSRVQNELNRAEREIVRQKSLRETERSEFSEAKERLKHSWANDREDFARVKTQLKTKNAEHHAQNGRLSQQLKEYEACNRELRDCLVRHSIAVPLDLEGNQHKRQLSGLPKGVAALSESELPILLSRLSTGQVQIRQRRGSQELLLQHIAQIEEGKKLSQSLPDQEETQTSCDIAKTKTVL